jgi:hypothetical protein
MEKKHYVCRGCKCVADSSGRCTTEECEARGRELDCCTCVDGQHTTAAEETEEETREG